VRCPAAIPAIALGAGIAVGIFDGPEVPPFLAGVACTAAAIGWLCRRDRLTCAALILGFLVVGALLGDRADKTARSTSLEALFDRCVRPGEHQLVATVEGLLRTDASKGPSGVTLDLLITRVEVEGATQTVWGGALIGVGGALGTDQIPQWRAGRRVALPATLRKPTRYLNPGVPDFERQLAWRGTTLIGAVKSDRLVEVVARGGAVTEALAEVRASIRRAIAASVSPWSDRSAAVVLAILIGDRAGLAEDVERRLQEAGTYHVIAISGGNIAILAGLCVLALRAVRVGTSVSALFVIALVTTYGLVVEGGSSVRRATLMAAIYFGARVCDQTTAPLQVAGLAAAMLFCLDPLEVVDAGFSLTFGATLGILVGLQRSAGLLPGRRWLLAPASLFATSLFAEIALLPISASLFSRVTFAGLLANFAAIPLMTVVQIAGMAIVGVAWSNAEVGRWLGGIVHFAVEGLIGSAAIVDVLPWLTRRLAPPSMYVTLLYYASLVACAIPTHRLASSVRRTSIAIATACGLWIAFAPSLNLALGKRPLRVTYLDVGQGDAAIVQFPNGRTLSVDAGGVSGSGFDIGERVVAPALWALGIRRLDYMSISHSDIDHVGGALSLFRDFGPLEMWEGIPVPPHGATRELQNASHQSGAVWRTVRSGDRANFGDVEVIVRHPPPPDWERQRVRNDDSEVIELRYEGVSFVFSGDISRDAERALAPQFDRVPIRILKVPHHGSATSSSNEFLKSLQPDVAVISAGRGNPFGHPAVSVLERYRQLGAAIYRTDQDGAVTVETDGTTVKVRTFTNRRLTLTTHGRW
jgi:competence protein ComEC